MEVKPLLRKEELLDWLFCDSDDAKQLGVKIITILQSNDSATVTVRELFDECGYIPTHILLNNHEFHEDEEFEPSEVELLN